MARLRVPNQRSNYLELNKRLGKYVALVQSVFDDLSKDASKFAISSGYQGDKEFLFSDYPNAKKAVMELQQKYVESLGAIIMRGTSAEWRESNLVSDLLADKALSYYGVKNKSGQRYRKYYDTNSDALKAFQKRKISGMNLSQNLWNQSKEMKTEMEFAISSAIQKGMSAVTLSKKVSKYLQDFESMKKDYKERYGHASTCHNCEYRSIRLARSEINMAYRTAEQERWKQMDFVLGYKIHLSGSHPMHDVCDMLAGKYPKDFVWTGWHPNDMCYCTPILMTEDEFFEENESKEDLEKRTIVRGDLGKYAEEVKDVILGLEQEYGVKVSKLDISRLEDESLCVYGNSVKEDVIIKFKDFPERYRIVKGVRVPTNVYGENVVVFHEYGHTITKDIRTSILEPLDYKSFEKTQHRSLSAEEKRRNYELYLERSRKGIKRLEDRGMLETAKELQKIWHEYKKADVSTWISIYSTSKEAEFYAECFAFVKKNGYGNNYYADRVCSLLDKYYFSNKRQSLSRKVTDVPDNFKAWCFVNKAKIESAEHLPYFIKDNIGYVAKSKNIYAEMTEDEKKSFDFVVSKIRDLQSRYGYQIYYDGILDDISNSMIRNIENATEYLERKAEDIAKVLQRSDTFKMSSSIASHIESRGYEGIGDIKEFCKEYKSSVLKSFDIVKDDDVFSNFAERYGIVVNRKICNINGVSGAQIVLNGYRSNEQNKREVFLLDRYFSRENGKLSLTIDRLHIPKEIRRKGLSKELLANVYDEFKTLGVQKVYLTTEQDGGYFWAKLGFLANKQDVLRIIQSSTAITEDQRNVALSIFDGWIKSHENQEYFPMKYLADLSFGEDLLINSRWDGVLDLTNPKNIENLEDFLRKK